MKVREADSFAALGLSDPLLLALQSEGYQRPYPIQTRAIPVALQGRDLLAAAQTGTGKTASFALPMLQRLADSRNEAGAGPRGLILAPTRELAAQVQESIAAYGKNTLLRSGVIYGGVPFEPQVAFLQRGIDILVATPGRLLDLLGQGVLTLDSVECLVLDEADRMLDLGFIDAVRQILRKIPAQRQSLLFSATFSEQVLQLAEGFLNNPVRIEVSARNSAAQTVRQSVYPVDWEDKPDTVRYLVEGGSWDKVLVFIRTKKSADQLAQQLVADGLPAAAIHSNKSQILRTRTLAAFKRGEVRVLVATDIAARGLDIEQLPLVINYDLPRVADDYVHRIGRSGRAGMQGRAMTLLGPSERKWLAGIERLLQRQLPLESIPFFENGIEQPSEPVVVAHKRQANQSGKKNATGKQAVNARKKRGNPAKGKPLSKLGKRNSAHPADEGVAKRSHSKPSGRAGGASQPSGGKRSGGKPSTQGAKKTRPQTGRDRPSLFG